MHTCTCERNPQTHHVGHSLSTVKVPHSRIRLALEPLVPVPIVINISADDVVEKIP